MPAAAGAAGNPTPLSAPRFVVTPSGGTTPKTWTFSELSNISMEVEPHEYIYTDSLGTITHTKQYGKTAPPKVTLKKPMDTDRTLWLWHLAVQAGNDMAKIDVALQVWNAGSPDVKPMSPPLFQWNLQKAWPSKLEVAGMKAGGTETGVLTVTFACELIEILTQNGAPTSGAASGSPF
jgi:phage tail-like protein